MTRLGSKVLHSFIDAISWAAALEQVREWAVRRESRYICLCNVHSVVTSSRDFALADVLNDADMATPDGAPVAWAMRWLGFRGQDRINGPDLMWRYCALAGEAKTSIYLYGSAPATLVLLQKRLETQFPDLQVAGAYSPPYRSLSAAEDAEVVDRINTSGATVVWVGLGCPKQEMWMAAHRGRVRAVMIGVGAAFDYHAGTIRRAPVWMQRAGLEWLHRLAAEPRRLWKRYLVTNTLFAFKFLKQMALERLEK